MEEWGKVLPVAAVTLLSMESDPNGATVLDNSIFDFVICIQKGVHFLPILGFQFRNLMPC